MPKPEEVSQFSIFPSPTSRRSILLINSALRASAAFMSVVVCFKVLVFDPKTTVPPTTAAIPDHDSGTEPDRSDNYCQDQDSSGTSGEF